MMLKIKLAGYGDQQQFDLNKVCIIETFQLIDIRIQNGKFFAFIVLFDSRRTPLFRA